MSSAHHLNSLTTVVLVTTALFVLAQLYLAIPLSEPVAADLGGTSVTFALSTVFSIFYAAGFLIWGPVSDTLGRKLVIVPGVFVLAVVTLACALAPSLRWMGFLRAVQGLVASSFAPIALAWLAEALPPQRRATAIGAMSTAFLIAGIFGQVLASSLTLWWHWKLVFVVSGVVLMAASAMLQVTMVEPVSDRTPSRITDRFLALAQFSVRRHVLLLGCAHITLLLSFVAMYGALGPHLVSLDFDPSHIIILRMAALPGMFAALSVGWLASRIGIAGVARVGFLLAAAGLVTEAATSQSLPGIITGSLIFVIGVALAVPSMISLFGAAAEPNRAAGMSLNGFVLFVGASIGPSASSTPFGFACLLITLAVTLALAAFFVTLSSRAKARAKALT